MNIYIAMGATGLCFNLIYYQISCNHEKKKLDRMKYNIDDGIATWRMKHNLSSYNAEAYNQRYGSNLTSREIRQIFSDKIDIAKSGLYYCLDIHRQNSARKLLISNPLFIVIMICKFLRRENVFRLRMDKKRGLHYLRELSKPLPRQLAIMDSRA